jgi:hypothetical protein
MTLPLVEGRKMGPEAVLAAVFEIVTSAKVLLPGAAESWSAPGVATKAARGRTTWSGRTTRRGHSQNAARTLLT